MIAPDHIVARLLQDPIIGQLPHATLSRLLPSIDVKVISTGETLAHLGRPVEDLILLVEGKLSAKSKSGSEINLSDGRIGDEILAGLPIQTLSVTARETSIVLLIPNKSIKTALKDYPDIQRVALEIFSDRLTHEETAKNLTAKPHQPSSFLEKREIIGWLCATFSPLFLIALLTPGSLPTSVIIFLAILLSASCMWLFSLVDEFIPPIFIIAVTLTLGIVPTNIALKGFGSEALFLFLGVYALGIVIEESGLFYRYTLWLLNRLPNHSLYRRAILLFSGFMLSPAMPSGNSRVAMLQPLYHEMIECLRAAQKSPSATILASATFSGAMLMSPMFLTSKPSNLIVVGFLPAALRDQFSSFFWFQSAFVAAMIVIIGQFITDRFVYGKLPDLPLPKQLIQEQSKLLGKLSQLEWVAFIALIFFLGAAITSSWHHLPLATISSLLLVSLLLFGAVSKTTFQKKIDWAMIFFLLAIDSLSAIMRSLDITGYMSHFINAIGLSLGDQIIYFIFFEFLVVSCIRLILPTTAGMIASALLLMPLAPAVGINPWVIGFLASLFSDAWFFPFQSSPYIQFRSKEGGSTGSYDETLFLRHNMILSMTKILAALASVPYWNWLGLI